MATTSARGQIAVRVVALLAAGASGTWSSLAAGRLVSLACAAAAAGLVLVAGGLFAVRPGLTVWGVGGLAVAACFGLGHTAALVDGVARGSLLLAVAEVATWAGDDAATKHLVAGRVLDRMRLVLALVGFALVACTAAAVAGNARGSGTVGDVLGGLAIGCTAILVVLTAVKGEPLA